MITQRNKIIAIVLLLTFVLLLTACTPSGEGGFLTTSYIGNKNTKVFHKTSCGNLPVAKNRVSFSSRSGAVSAGYTPCRVCKP